MTAEIAPHSFKLLALDIRNGIDFDFFDDSPTLTKAIQPSTTTEENVLSEDQTTAIGTRNGDSLMSFGSYDEKDKQHTESCLVTSQSQSEREVEEEINLTENNTIVDEESETSVNDDCTYTLESQSHVEKPTSTGEKDNAPPNSLMYRSSKTGTTLKQDTHCNKPAVDQIAVTLNKINKHLNSSHFRPPWQDPNSHQLPSDRTAIFYSLYEKFSGKMDKKKTLVTPQSYVTINSNAILRPYHSALNRYRQQTKIQLENYDLARRLQNIRPTTGMTKDEQLREYRRVFLRGDYINSYPVSLRNSRPTSSSMSDAGPFRTSYYNDSPEDDISREDSASITTITSQSRINTAIPKRNSSRGNRRSTMFNSREVENSLSKQKRSTTSASSRSSLAKGQTTMSQPTPPPPPSPIQPRRQRRFLPI